MYVKVRARVLKFLEKNLRETLYDFKIDLLNGIQKALCIKEKLGNLTLKIKSFTHKNVIY